MKIPILEKEGFEADDIIGTVAKDAEENNFKVYMVTPDKDFAQLVSNNIFLCKPARMGNSMEIWGVDEVKDKFEVQSPDQVIDYLGMMGDSVDNIPGLPGVGDKTAKKFIKQYGSLENLLQYAHEVTGKLGEKILENKELGVPIDYNLDEFKLSDPDKDIVLRVFDELEFRRIKETFFKIFGTNSSKLEEKGAEVVQGDLFSETYNLDSNKENLDDSKSIYQIIESFEELKLLVEKMMEQEIVAFDTETEGLNALETNIVGISFSWRKGIGYYLPIKNNKSVYEKSFEILKPFFESTKIIKLGRKEKIKYQ